MKTTLISLLVTLYTLSLDVPTQFSFPFWWNYVEYCREIATQTGMSMREVDQALWQYSKENQESV